ncbi:MAG: hypothetical protein IJ803_02505 [Oribacterium sp.]|nr:hypothetical protein [Oribacterium sp.]
MIRKATVKDLSRIAEIGEDDIRMMIALAAVGFKNGDIAYNKEKIKTVIRDHGNRQVDLILFGETFLQGFDSLSWNYDSDKSIAVKMNDPVIDVLIYN